MPKTRCPKRRGAPRRSPFVVVLASILIFGAFTSFAAAADAPPTRDEATAALLKAVRFFHEQAGVRGGYVWQYSGDLKLREGEGTLGPDTVWVQPPGTPAVGEAFLDAFEATGAASCLDAAKAAGMALAMGQLHSGGWNYRIEFDPTKRQEWSYRLTLEGQPNPDPTPAADRDAANGWDVWKRRRYKGNQTVLDDDTTQAAVRFLMRLDRTLAFKHAVIHAAAEAGLSSLLNSQYPNGGWSANYDRFQTRRPDEQKYPIKPAAYPSDWPKTWPKDFTGCYVTNDNLMSDCIDTMLLAWEIYGDQRYRAAAERAGDFLIAAQMPDPQPAWAQQYDRDMQPCWSRAFEPPAVTGGESQGIMRALIRLYERTGDRKYLAPIPRAIEYLRKSHVEGGQLARFYELKTNRPIYFNRNGPGGRHQLSYDTKDLATGYGYIIESNLDAIEKEYQRALRDGPATRPAAPKPPGPPSAKLTEQAREIMAAMDGRGAWVERGARMKHHKVAPESGVIDCRAFCRNVEILSRYVAAKGKPEAR